MKMRSGIILTILCLCSIINCDPLTEDPQIGKFIFNNYNFLTAPRVAHIANNYNKVIKPIIDRPFLPQEVENLADAHNREKRNLSYNMETAQIIGNPAPRGKGDEVSLYIKLESFYL